MDKPKTLTVKFTFDDHEWMDYRCSCPELVLEDMELNLKNGVEVEILDSTGFGNGYCTYHDRDATILSAKNEGKL